MAAGAAVFGAISFGAAALSSVFTGIEHGFSSGEFYDSAIGTALNVFTRGQSKWLVPAAKKVISPVVNKVAEEGKELVSSITSGLSSIF
ncbi:hypothetical protein [Streptomyces sp. NPDC051662]|uniref:hypothetical protein n=1 Tax=Streptomyces sp. NPDC051662 TaxID=3154750 RepID=UPI0034415E6F